MEEKIKQELLLFFSENNNKVIDDFKEEFKKYILIDKRIDKVIYLLKLFKDETQEAIKLVKVNDSLELKNYINNLNSIIRYLKQYINSQRKKPITRKKSTIDQRKKYRKKDINLIFEPKLLSLVESFETDYNFSNFSYDEIINLIKYYNNKKINIISHKSDLKGLEVEKELKKINLIFSELVTYKNKFLSSDPSEVSHVKLPVSDDQIRDLDESLGISTFDIVQNLRQDSIDSFNGVETLLEIYIEQFNLEKGKKDGLVSKRRKLKNNNADGANSYLIEECNQLISKMNIHMDILNNLINYLKRYSKGKTSRQNSDINIFEDEIEINSTQRMIQKTILLEKDIGGYELKDILFAIGHYIKSGEPIDKNLLKYVRDIFNQCSTITIEDEMLLKGIHYVWDSIKYRLTSTSKEDTKTREILKDIRILFDYIVKNYKIDSQKLSHDYLFDIVDHFLKSEDYFLYINRLVKEMPDIVNVRHLRDDDGVKKSEHVVIYILNKFISNYRMMLKDKKSSYINKDYLKSVYLLFIRSYQLYLTKEEKCQIDILLADFMKDVNKNLTSSRRKNEVRQDLKDMYTDKFYANNKDLVLKDINEHRLEWQMNNISYTLSQSNKKKNKVDLTHEDSFVIGSAPYAYSIQKYGNERILKIHVINLYDLIVKDSELDKYLYNQTLQNEELDSFFVNQILMNKNKVYSTITYEISFDEYGNYKDENGQIRKFNIYESKISISERYTDFSLTNVKDEILLRGFVDLYRTSMIRNSISYNHNCCMDSIKRYFEVILNQGITEYFKANDLPFIYSGIEDKSEEEFIHNLNQIGHILSRLDSDSLRTIYSVLENNVDEFHYSVNEFTGEYQLYIQNPINYVGFSLQRVLHELVLDNKHNEEEYKRALKKYKQEFKELVMHLNYYNSYIDKEILKQNKGKIKKEQKILF